MGTCRGANLRYGDYEHRNQLEKHFIHSASSRGFTSRRRCMQRRGEWSRCMFTSQSIKSASRFIDSRLCYPKELLFFRKERLHKQKIFAWRCVGEKVLLLIEHRRCLLLRAQKTDAFIIGKFFATSSTKFHRTVTHRRNTRMQKRKAARKRRTQLHFHMKLSHWVECGGMCVVAACFIVRSSSVLVFLSCARRSMERFRLRHFFECRNFDVLLLPKTQEKRTEKLDRACS